VAEKTKSNQKDILLLKRLGFLKLPLQEWDAS
jgi:hypothetical protein